MTETLIPRTRLFGNPTRAQGQISPDGRWLSWLAPKDGVLNIWVAPAGDMGAARVLTDDRKRGVRFHAWANSSAHVLYIQDEGGTEDWHVYAVPVEGGPARDLTPLPGVNARIQELSLDEPHVMAVGLNDRDKAWHDVYRIDIRTGERERLYENRKELAGVVLDRQLHPRLAIKPRNKEGGHIVYRVAGANLEPIMVIEHEPRQGRAARQRLAIRQGAAHRRASQGRHQPRDDKPAHARGRGGWGTASDAGLDPAR
jgi:hypothetical protein